DLFSFPLLSGNSNAETAPELKIFERQDFGRDDLVQQSQSVDSRRVDNSSITWSHSSVFGWAYTCVI
ncbi:MAG: hypothetical protein ACR2PG_14605, partial [Hyphomicrobiaceae bacterium]